ncbi:MAG: hypothetical protein Q9163_003870 [Psora crenata]
MPEQIIESQQPLKDAINRVTNNGRDKWTFTAWTTPGTANFPTKIVDQISQENATSGMRGVVTHPNGTTKNFTIRHDYDFALGMPSDGNGGKGYHVNVELPNEKFAFSSKTRGENYFADCVQMLSQRRLHDGDEAAANWFMEPKENQQTKQDVVLKAAPDFLFRNERNILKRFQTISLLRRLIDEVQDPPLLVLEYLDSNLLTESATKRVQSSEVKHITKSVLQALAALHEEGIVHTGA